MNKLSKQICGALLLVLLVGCNSTINSTSSTNSSSPVISTSTVSTNNNQSTNSSTISANSSVNNSTTSANSSTTSANSSTTSSSSSTKEEVSSDDFPIYSEFSDDCSLSDGLIDIDLGLAIATGTQLQVGFGFSNVTSANATIEISHPDVLKYEYVGGRHIIKGLKAGKSYIVIKDFEGFIHYRKVVTVKDPLTEDEIYDHLFNVDKWHSWFGPSTLVFLENKTGVYRESDGFSVSGSFEFTYELDRIDNVTNEFIFIFTEVREKTVEWTPVGFNVSLVGDIIHIQDTNMTSDILQETAPSYGSWN